jgi:hypothetical protein
VTFCVSFGIRQFDFIAERLIFGQIYQKESAACPFGRPVLGIFLDELLEVFP